MSTCCTCPPHRRPPRLRVRHPIRRGIPVASALPQGIAWESPVPLQRAACEAAFLLQHLVGYGAVHVIHVIARLWNYSEATMSGKGRSAEVIEGSSMLGDCGFARHQYFSNSRSKNCTINATHLVLCLVNLCSILWAITNTADITELCLRWYKSAVLITVFPRVTTRVFTPGILKTEV